MEAKVIPTIGYPSRVRKAAVLLYDQYGFSLGDLERLFGIGKTTLARWMRDESVTRGASESRRLEMGRRTGKDYEMIEASAVGFYLVQKMNTKEIADRLGVARSWVEAMLKKAGVFEGRSSRVSLGVKCSSGREERVFRAVELKDEGYSCEDIASIMGVSTWSVRAYLRDGFRERKERTVSRKIQIKADPEFVEMMISELDGYIDRGADSRLILRGARRVLSDVHESLTGE